MYSGPQAGLLPAFGSRPGSQRPSQSKAVGSQVVRQPAPRASAPRVPPQRQSGPPPTQAPAQRRPAQQPPSQVQPAPTQQADVNPLARPARVPANLKWGTVKQVETGDTIVLMGQQSGLEPGPSMTVSILGVKAPNVARSQVGREDAYGWNAKEYLRKKLIGQHVQFVDKVIEPSRWEMNGRKMERHYAQVYFQNQNVAEDLVMSGLCKRSFLKNEEREKYQKEKPELYHQFERLRALEKQAMDAGRGQWARNLSQEEHDKNFRRTSWPSETDEMKELFQKMLGKKVRAIVDKVQDGSTIRLEILPEKAGDDHIIVRVKLAGIECPRVPMSLEMIQSQWDDRKRRMGNRLKTVRPEVAETPPPMALAAKNYVEVRLLNREVIVEARCTDPFGNMFVTISPANAPDRDICFYVLQQGLAKVTRWNLRKLPQVSQQRYTQAEKQAQDARGGLWKTTPIPQQKQANEARVIQVLSGDSLILDIKGDGTETRCNLASIRSPKMGNRRGGILEDPEPFALDAKEFLRCKVINQNVRYVIEYKRERDDPGMIERFGKFQVFVSLYVGENKENISASLVNLGYAEVVTHRLQDPRADSYAVLMDREADAKQRKAGMWGDSDKQRYKPLDDLTQRFDPKDKSKEMQRARVYKMNKDLFDTIGPKKVQLGMGEKPKPGKRFDGCVEHIFNAARLKIAVPSKNKIITLILVGIMPQRVGFGSEDKVAKRAYDMVRSVLLQRNVKFSVEALDRGGNFIGHIWLGNKQNLGEELLRRGLAKIRPESAERSSMGEKLIKAQDQAKQQREGYWENYDPAAEAAAAKTTEVDVAQTDLTGKTVQGVVTHIADAATFYFVPSDDPNEKLVNETLPQIDTSKNFTDKIRNGAIVAATFQGAPYRARTIRFSGGKHTVRFIDYGNESDVSKAEISPLPEALLQIPPLAYKCRLAGLFPPPIRSEYYYAAGKAFSKMIDGQRLTCKVIAQTSDRNNNQILHVTALNQNGEDVNREMTAQGFVRIDSRPPQELVAAAGFKDVSDANENARKVAYKAHTGMWQYGDPGSDNEDEN